MHATQATPAQNHDEDVTAGSATIKGTRLSLAPARFYESLAALVRAMHATQATPARNHDEDSTAGSATME